MENNENKNDLTIKDATIPESVPAATPASADAIPKPSPAADLGTHKKPEDVSNDLAIKDEIIPGKDEDNTEFDSKEFDRLVKAEVEGTLSEDDKKAIKDKKINEHYFRLAVKERLADRKENESKLFAVAGSQESYMQMLNWAQNSLTKEDKALFNKAVRESGDIGIATMAVENLFNKFQKQNGNPPTKVISGGAAPVANNEQAFGNQQDYIKATQDRKYGKDPVYTAQVDNRRNKSGF